MRIGIDGNEANVSIRVGVGEYSYALLQEFKNIEDSTLIFQIYLKNTPLSHMPSRSENWIYKVVKPHVLWTQFGLPFSLFTTKDKPNVFFTPTHYAPRFSPSPTVISVMDVSYLHYPHLFKKTDLYKLKNWTAYSIKNAARVLTISNASKDDIIKHYKVADEKVIVTYPGIKPFKAMKTTTKPIVEDKYILFVGTLQPRKNIQRLIEAFSMIKKDIEGYKLVICGKKGWLYDEILAAPEKFGVKDSVVFKYFVSEDELNNLYTHAQVFVLPSLYEGFGLPVLEAMQRGCPVITSSISSLPEAGGDAALYVDPANVSDIAQKIQRVLDDKKLREDMIKKGYVQVKKFSWEKTARQTLDVLREVGNER